MGIDGKEGGDKDQSLRGANFCSHLSDEMHRSLWNVCHEKFVEQTLMVNLIERLGDVEEEGPCRLLLVPTLRHEFRESAWTESEFGLLRVPSPDRT